MYYRGIADLSDDVRELAHDLPDDIDLVIAVPRSGLLAADLLSLYLDVPMTDVAGLCRGEVFETGDRHAGTVSMADVDTALVFDDSVHTGTEMTEKRELLSEEEFPFDLEYGAVYITYDGHEYVDHWQEVVPTPRVFEWNVLHHYHLHRFCVEIDGVLCRDPAEEGVDDEEAYRERIRNAKSKIVPNRRIGWLVTDRPETYHEETEAWLDEHGIEYDTLIMRDRSDAAAHRGIDDRAEYKATVYEQTGADLFIESSEPLATEICARTNRSVYCHETAEMVRPNRIEELYRISTDYLSMFRERPLRFPVDASEQVVDRVVNRIQR